ncbi:MAG: Arc family DNA-binding protein [Peptoniphilus sp.]|nr:Arc family DNA-binding protein [Peptoniphilus sp.]
MKQFNVRTTEELYNKVAEQAEREKRSISNYIIKVLEEELERIEFF